MKLYCVRHGQTNYNILNLCTDKEGEDIYLTEEGIKQANDASEKLKDIKFDFGYISKLYRTKQTGDIINKYHNLKLVKDSRLNDNITGFEGKPLSEYIKAFNLAKDKWNARFNNGESFEDEKVRIKKFLDELKTKNYKCVLIITHEAIIRKISGNINKLSNEEIIKIDVPNCSIHEFEL